MLLVMRMLGEMSLSLPSVRSFTEFARAGGPAPSITLWLFPWSSYVAIAAMIAVLMAMAFTPGLGGELYASLITLAVAAGAGCVVLRARRRSMGVQAEAG